MGRLALEVADIFRTHGASWRKAQQGHLSLGQLKVTSAIEQCRSAALGGHLLHCQSCEHGEIAYNSCRNRHCPKCQASAAKRWLEARQAELRPVDYCHEVHTEVRQEALALTNLNRQGFECYVPMLRIKKLRRHKATLVEEPMFPRYLFIRLKTSGSGQSWSPIRSTLGVSQLVRFGGQPAVVDSKLIEISWKVGLSPGRSSLPGRGRCRRSQQARALLGHRGG